MLSILFDPQGLVCSRGERHGHQQASGHTTAGYPGQPVRFAHRQGRLQNQRDQRGECLYNRLFISLSFPLPPQTTSMLGLPAPLHISLLGMPVKAHLFYIYGLWAVRMV